MKKVLTCVGTRPNFIKITQLEKHFNQYSHIEHKLLHTGQHFDDNMSEVFFKELNIRQPDVFLNLNQGTQLEIIANIITAIEKYLIEYQPDLVIVPGDVNSSFACAFAASRLNIPVAHLESGLRSFDKMMPEEVNRILIDDLADLFFVTEQSGIQNLYAENKPKNKIHLVGNTMIDTLVDFTPLIDKSNIVSNIKHQVSRLTTQELPLATLTFHRPSNVDNPEQLKKVISLIVKLSEHFTVVFPVHPRTRSNIDKFNLNIEIKNISNIVLTDPLGYIDFLKLVKESKVVITDSGGIQEETTFLSIPCLTIRTSTERPVTITEGTNTLLDLDEKLILNVIDTILDNKYKSGRIPELWDGKASERIVKIISEYMK